MHFLIFEFWSFTISKLLISICSSIFAVWCIPKPKCIFWFLSFGKSEYEFWDIWLALAYLITQNIDLDFRFLFRHNFKTANFNLQFNICSLMYPKMHMDNQNMYFGIFDRCWPVKYPKMNILIFEFWSV